MSSYQVRLPVFEGPFDLLYHLIEEQKINIYDIPIAKIAGQYLEYLQMMEILDMEVASGFLIMAATLLEIKSRMLLPKEKPVDLDGNDFDIDDESYEDDVRSDLVERLLEYKRIKLVALELREMERNASRIFTRRSDIERQPEEILEINVGSIELLNIYHVMVRQRINPPVHRVILEKIGIADRINEIRALLKAVKGEFRFDLYLKKAKSRFEKVLSFMAVLEMDKAGELIIQQKANFKPIILHPPNKVALKSRELDANDDEADRLTGEEFNFTLGDSDE